MNSNPRIAVIDDEVLMTGLLKMVLEDHLNCTVEQFNDPFLGLKRLNEQVFDAISLDYRMPGMTGMEIVKILRSTPSHVNAKTPILIFTGFREEAEELAMGLMDNLLFLEKPIEDAKYVHHVRIALEMKNKAA